MFSLTRAFKLCFGNELLPADANLAVAQYTEDDKIFGQVITAGAFLPRVQLYGGNSEAAKEGKIGVGRYGLTRSKDSIVDMTNQFDCLPISFRFKAMRITKEGNIFTYHNPTSPEFKKVMVDSEVQNSGCMYGAEFLLWLPVEECFATLYLSSKTARREAPALKDLMKERKAATLAVNYIKKGAYSWHGPTVKQCSTPFAVPPMEDIVAQAETFANPAESKVEQVETVPEGRPQ